MYNRDVCTLVISFSKNHYLHTTPSFATCYLVRKSGSSKIHNLYTLNPGERDIETQIDTERDRDKDEDRDRDRDKDRDIEPGIDL